MNNAVINASVNVKTVTNTKATNKSDNYFLQNNCTRNTKDNISKKDNFKKLLDKTCSNDKTAINSTENGIKKSAYSETTDLNKVDSNNLGEVKEEDSKKVSDPIDLLMLLLLKLMNGEIDTKEFRDKLSQNPETMDQIPDVLSNDILNKIKGQLQLSESQLANLYSKLKNEIGEALENTLNSSNLKDMSLDEIVSNLNEKIVKVLDESQLNLSKVSDDENADFKEQIVNLLKAKLFQGESKDNLEANKAENLTLKSFINDEMQSKLNLKIAENADTNGKSNFQESNNEDKFLQDLASGNKNDVSSKLDKVVSFMNGFNKINDLSGLNEVNQNVTINKNTFVNDIIKSVKFMEQSNMKEMTVKIMPRELGEVIIKLTMENGLMKANITANNKEAYNLLNSNIQEINNKLGNGEIKIQNFTVDIYNGDTTFFSRENSKGQERQSTSGNGKNNISRIGEESEDINSSAVSEESNINALV